MYIIATCMNLLINSASQLVHSRLVTLIVAPDLHDAGGGSIVEQGFI